MRFLAALAVVVSGGTALANPSYEDAREQAYADAMAIAHIKGGTSTCAVIGEQVKAIMLIRFSGMAMSEQLSEPNYPFFHYVIRDAYKQPFYSTRNMQAQAVRDFRERYENECYDALGFSG